MGNTGTAAIQWDQLRDDVLRQRSTALLGPPNAAGEKPALTCTARYTSAGEILVTVDEACTLGDVHDLLVRIARACLNDDTDVLFAREGQRPTAAQVTFPEGPRSNGRTPLPNTDSVQEG